MRIGVGTGVNVILKILASTCGNACLCVCARRQSKVTNDGVLRAHVFILRHAMVHAASTVTTYEKYVLWLDIAMYNAAFVCMR